MAHAGGGIRDGLDQQQQHALSPVARHRSRHHCRRVRRDRRLHRRRTDRRWLVAVLGLVFFFPPTIVAYVILALVLRPKPPALYAGPDEEAFWRGVGTAPADTLHSLKRKFADLEARLGQMESQVTSGDFDLHRKFRDLGR